METKMMAPKNVMLLGARAAYAGHSLKHGFEITANTYPDIRGGHGPVNFALGWRRGAADKAAGYSLEECEKEVMS